MKGKKTTSKGQLQQLGEDSADDFVLPSDFEENDEDLANYLQANSSFLMNMHATGAFTVLSLCLELFFFIMFAFLLNYAIQDWVFTEDVSKLGRKYLPPGTLYEVYQFYLGWCSAHGVMEQASHLVLEDVCGLRSTPESNQYMVWL